ncbi:MAG: YitT family protein [Lachnospiraceae bacterium]|nr:YitT family protein [Lachnospiraceae bacterium]
MIFKKEKKKELENYVLAALGSLIYAVAMNQIIVPLNLYSGGFFGIVQLIRTGVGMYISIPESLNLTGVIYYAMNVPLFVMAWKIIGREFLFKTILTCGIQAFFLTLIPIAAEPLTEDPLTSCIIAGIVSGVGCGVVLQSGCSSGGQDIVGICCAKRYPQFSVGKVAILMNIIVFGACAVLFDLEIVIYSMIYTTIMSLCVDRLHTQNINTMVLIFTKNPNVASTITCQMRRGVTAWNGKGVYTDEKAEVLCVVVSKHEVAQLKQIVQELDKHAFLVLSEGTKVIGNFEKRLNE